MSLVGGGDSRLERLAGIELLFEALTQIGDRLADELLLLSDAGVRPCPRNGVDHPLFMVLTIRSFSSTGNDSRMSADLRPGSFRTIRSSLPGA